MAEVDEDLVHAARANSFGRAAAQYERSRPDYPDSAVDLVLAGLEVPIRALEVGAGTGKLTRLLARRGVSVTACEPSADMARAMRSALAAASSVESRPDRADAAVHLIATSFEALPEALAESPFDLVVGAAAWHWTDPDTRWRRAACLVRPGGTIAGLGGPIDIADDALRARVDRIRQDAVVRDEMPPRWAGRVLHDVVVHRARRTEQPAEWPA